MALSLSPLIPRHLCEARSGGLLVVQTPTALRQVVEAEWHRAGRTCKTVPRMVHKSSESFPFMDRQREAAVVLRHVGSPMALQTRIPTRISAGVGMAASHHEAVEAQDRTRVASLS